jgi:glyoxylase-like metal-dependent hydrolase (beta-lactamase superfamily II)/rhodanese-related sulfurtransferase
MAAFSTQGMDIGVNLSLTERPEEKADLKVETFYLSCLAQGSYLVSHGGNAFLIDPRRDVDVYLKKIASEGLRLKGILETHVHADFVSGHRELNERTGATIFINEHVQPGYRHYPVTDGDLFVLSDVYAFVPMYTPGHTLGCTTWLLVDRLHGNRPMKAFTGDTLFVGSVGRPDLLGSVGYSKHDMAHLLFHSLHDKLLCLPDDVEVYPAHGAGSPCGKGLSTDLSSTIGRERTTNPALLLQDEDSFVHFLTDEEQSVPQYFPAVVALNVEGAVAMGEEVNKVPMLSPAAFEALLEEEVKEGELAPLVLDTREPEDFDEGHIEGSLNFAIGFHGGDSLSETEGNFGIWIGTLIAPGTPLLLVTAPGKEVESIQRLGRVGYAGSVKAVLGGGIPSWVVEGRPLSMSNRIALSSERQLESFVVLDIRQPSEFACTGNGRVRDALSLPLDTLCTSSLTPPATSASGVSLNLETPYICYCRGGYRSAIAKSILLKQGLNVSDIQRGFRAVQEGFPHLLDHSPVAQN